MKVFIAGATGVVGRRAAARLVEKGFDVTGAVRSERSADLLRGLGATPVAVSLFDADAVGAAVSGHDVVINLATSIPTGERAGELSAWEENHRIRRDASRNLVDAALAAGAERYVQESIALLYADGGDDLLDETAPLDPTAVTASALDAEAQPARFADGGGTGVALRFSFFYGDDSAHTLDSIAAAWRGISDEMGPVHSFRSSITTDDAASAVVAALRVPSGVYNVTDDEAMRRGDFVHAMEEALGVGPLQPVMADIELPPDFAMMTRSLRVSNARFKDASGWTPQFPSAREGWPHVVAQVLARDARQS